VSTICNNPQLLPALNDTLLQQKRGNCLALGQNYEEHVTELCDERRDLCATFWKPGAVHRILGVGLGQLTEAKGPRLLDVVE